MSYNPANIENPTRKCSDCKKDIVCKFSKFHKATTNGDNSKRRRKFEDETGRLWHGTRCPDCTAKWRRDTAAKKAESIQDKIKAELEKA